MRYFIFTLLLLVLISCDQSEEIDHHKDVVAMKSEMIPFDADNIEIVGELNGFDIQLSTKEIEVGLELISIKLTNDKEAKPPKFSLKWKFPSQDIAKFWNPNLGVNKANYYHVNVSSHSTKVAPVITFMNTNDENRFAFAIADALNKVHLSAFIMEEDAYFHCEAVFFDEPYPAINVYETEIIIDRRKKPFYNTLTGITNWWAEKDNYKPAIPPKDAFKSVYSTWYSYHQNLNVDEIVEECRQSKEMGVEVLIVDDGWQTLDNKRGYAYTGDWKPDRIPDMKGFVDQIHDLDMKFMLWYSVPFIGKEAEIYPQYKGKYLYYWESQGTWVLDPRYPEVREFIIGTYEKAINDWGLDGFKLDFMGFFGPSGDTEFTAKDGRDYASINHAVDKLMTDIMSRLKEINPDILIEFRQPYIGPLMRKYGNMLRAADCPNMATINRVRVTDTRLLAGNSAVHADMLMWHPEDAVQHAALQILNIIFSVPQISVRLNEVPQEHKDMIAFWMDYCKQNQEVLLQGDFIPQMPDHLYPMISSIGKEKAITAVYDDSYVETKYFKDLPAFDIINARNKTEVVLLNHADVAIYTMTVSDCKGKVIYTEIVKLNEGARVIPVPPSGLISFVKNQKN